MTIAACYLSSEGVVLGSDSTSTRIRPGSAVVGNLPRFEHFNFAQKVFEFGKDSTAGIVFWGLGAIGETSLRSIVADAEMQAKSKGISKLTDVAQLFSQIFWTSYVSFFGKEIAYLNVKPGNADEERQQEALAQGLSGGFCIGGHWGNETAPQAWVVQYSPRMPTAPMPMKLSIGQTGFWGWSNLVERLVVGIDSPVLDSILKSGKWNGTKQDLESIVLGHSLYWPDYDLPIREAIDWVHASIYATIKTMKFAPLEKICGGPIEVAVITTDRQFRWVCHKNLDEAIGVGH